MRVPPNPPHQTSPTFLFLSWLINTQREDCGQTNTHGTIRENTGTGKHRVHLSCWLISVEAAELLGSFASAFETDDDGESGGQMIRTLGIYTHTHTHTHCGPLRHSRDIRPRVGDGSARSVFWESCY